MRTSAPQLSAKFIDKGTRFFRVDEKGKPLDYLAVDQFSAKPFMMNASGFVCNDIMAFEEAESDSVARAVLQRCQVLHPELSHDPDLSVNEIFERIIPANFGSPTDFVRLQTNLAKLDFERIESLKAAEKAKLDKISFAESPSAIENAAVESQS